jgi:hypothetical protein
MHIDLRRKGYVLYMAGEAVTRHVNVSDFVSFCRIEYIGQRGFAAARAHAGNWSRLKRGLYVLGSPLIPVVRMFRIVQQIRRARRARELLPQILVPIAPALVFGMVGEAVGYILGDQPENLSRRSEIELNRLAFVAEQDRQNSPAK